MAGAMMSRQKRLKGRAEDGADDLTGIADLEVDVWVVLRWFIPNALELAAANAHDRHPDFIMKLRITFHLQRAA